MEDLLVKNGEDKKEGVQGKHDRSRVWKICWMRIGEDDKGRVQGERPGADIGRSLG